MAHELAHVVQQEQSGGGLGAEPRAEVAAERVVSGQWVGRDTVGGASPGLYTQGVAEGGDRSEALCLTGPPVETFKLDAEIDAMKGRNL